MTPIQFPFTSFDVGPKGSARRTGFDTLRMSGLVIDFYRVVVRSCRALRLTVRPEALEGTNGPLRRGPVEA